MQIFGTRKFFNHSDGTLHQEAADDNDTGYTSAGPNFLMSVPRTFPHFSALFPGCEKKERNWALCILCHLENFVMAFCLRLTHTNHWPATLTHVASYEVAMARVLLIQVFRKHSIFLYPPDSGLQIPWGAGEHLTKFARQTATDRCPVSRTTPRIQAFHILIILKFLHIIWFDFRAPREPERESFNAYPHSLWVPLPLPLPWTSWFLLFVRNIIYGVFQLAASRVLATWYFHFWHLSQPKSIIFNASLSCRKD